MEDALSSPLVSVHLGPEGARVGVFLGPEQQDVDEDVSAGFFDQRPDAQQSARRASAVYSHQGRVDDMLDAAEHHELGSDPREGRVGSGRERRDSEDGDAALARDRTVVQIGNEYKQNLNLKEDKTAVKVDNAFQKLKIGFRNMLVATGEITEEQGHNFKMKINLTRQIVQWWINDGDSEVHKGQIDIVNDGRLTEVDHQNIRRSSNEIIKATQSLTGHNTTHVEDIPAGCIAPLGNANLARLFDGTDHSTFKGSLYVQDATRFSKKKTPDDMRKSAFSKYMLEEFSRVSQKPGARDSKAVVKDVASALMLQKGLLVAITTAVTDLRAEYNQELDQPGDVENTKTRAIKADITTLRSVHSRFAGMHMNPTFVGKSYEAPDVTVQSDTFRRADALKGYFESHYSDVDRNRSRIARMGNRLSKYAVKQPHKELALLLAGKEVFKGDRPSFVQYNSVHNQLQGTSLGMEEVFFDRLLEVHRDGGGFTTLTNLGLLAGLSEQTRNKMLDSINSVQIEVNTMRLNMQTLDCKWLIVRDVKSVTEAVTLNFETALARLT